MKWDDAAESDGGAAGEPLKQFKLHRVETILEYKIPNAWWSPPKKDPPP